MEIAKIQVTGVYAEILSSQEIPHGIIGAKIAFVFDEAWDALRKTVVFHGCCTKDILDAGEVVTIPAEVVSEPGKTLYVGVYGTDEDGTLAIPTVWVELGMIRYGTDPSGDASTDPSLPVWAQIQTVIGSLEDLNTMDRTSLVAAVNEALTTGGSGIGDPVQVERIVQAYLAQNPPAPGKDGNPGRDGSDGVSASHVWNGTVLTITSASGTSSADLKGEKGDAGPQGPQGETGPQGATGPVGADGADGSDYVLTSADKSEIAEMVENATIVQSPKYVHTVEEMTDSNRPYVLISTGRIWANAETSVVSSKTEACDEAYTYPENSRLSSGNISSTNGYTVTPYIDLLAYPVPYTLHLDGAAFVPSAYDNYSRQALYKEDQTLLIEEKKYVATIDDILNVSDSDVAIDSAGNGRITFNSTPTAKSGAGLRYLRLAGKVFGTPHVYVTYQETTTGVQWFDTGTTYAPTLTADERQSIVNEVINQIDTELLSVIGSGEVV